MAELLDRVPPQNLEAEQATLGAMLMERDAIARVVDLLESDDFCSPQHQLLYRVIADLFSEGKPVDLVTVQSRLQDMGRLESVGGRSYLIALQEPAPTAAAVEYYARIVQEKAALRALVAAGDEVKRLAYEGGDDDITAVIGRARALFEELHERHRSGKAFEWFTYSSFLSADFGEPEPVVESLLESATIVFAYGPAGAGKSFYAAELARCIASGRRFLGRFDCTKGACVIVEQESPRRKLQERYLLLEGGISTPDDAAEVRVVPLQVGFTLDRPKILAGLCDLVAAVSAKLLVIDTLVAVAGGLDMLNPTQVRGFCTSLRPLADRTGVAILLLAHTPKYVDGEPDLSHLFGSQDWGAAGDAAFEFVALAGDAPVFRVCCTKGRWLDRKDWPDFTFDIRPGEFGGVILTAGEAREAVAQIILRTVGPDEATPAAEIVKAVRKRGYTRQAANDNLRRMLATGELVLDPGSTERRRAFRRAS